MSALQICLLFLTVNLPIRDVYCSPVPLSAEKPANHTDGISDLQLDVNPETIEEETNTEIGVGEGDMLLLDDRNADVRWTWPVIDGKVSVPYVISEDLVHRAYKIQEAFNMVSKNTCVTFHRRTTEWDYLIFKDSKGCASYVGLIGGKQPVFVGPYCHQGNIAHEILHALGFYHEHTREDRDDHVTVVFSNIVAGMEKNFVKRPGETNGVDYDLGSILHYGGRYFSKNLEPSIIAHEGGYMGQRNRLSEKDVEKVNLLYKCTSHLSNDGATDSPSA